MPDYCAGAGTCTGGVIHIMIDQQEKDLQYEKQ